MQATRCDKPTAGTLLAHDVHAPLAEYDNVTAVFSAYAEHDSLAGSARVIHLKLWRADFGPPVTIRRIELKPGAVPGHKFLHVAEGWGLLDLQIGRPIKGRLSPSRIAVNSGSRARQWEDTLAHQVGPVADWNWGIVAKTARRLQYHIARRLAVAKRGNRPVLAGAEAARANGIAFAEV